MATEPAQAILDQLERINDFEREIVELREQLRLANEKIAHLNEELCLAAAALGREGES